jgi:hypothetical protein
MLKQTDKRSILRAAATAAVAALWLATGASTATAQYRIENGRALDANKRIGDDGRNDLGVNYRAETRATPNQIVTGNVAGLYGFRGNVGYREASEFRGQVASQQSDLFIRRSSGGYSGYGGRATGSNYPTAFYTQSRVTDPPPNYMREGFGLGSYVPNPNAPRSTNAYGPADTVVRYDTASNRGYFDQIGSLPPPSNLVLPAPAGSGEGSYISATPLTGIQQYKPGQALTGDQAFSSTNNVPRTANGVRLNDAQIRQMQDELRTSTPGMRQTNLQQQPGDSGDGGTDSGATGATPLGKPIGSPLGQPRDATASVQQTTRYQFNLPPEQQSAQYAKMRHQLDAFNQDKTKSDEEAFRQYQQAKKKGTLEALPKPTAPGEQDPNSTPNAQPGTPGTDQTGARPSQSTDAKAGDKAKTGKADAGEASAPPRIPIKVDSLASGISGKGLSELMSDAEAKMRDGKFAAAIDRYESAAQVAPNNPLIALGRANAELGAGYYARAEAHLRQAFGGDHALLMGQYNLQKFMGEDRLRYLTKDLKDIANREKTEARPVFLLAYVAYNTGNERMAAGYLDLAQKRGNPKDPMYPLVRKLWNLPEIASTPEGVEEPATKPAQAPTAATGPVDGSNK